MILRCMLRGHVLVVHAGYDPMFQMEVDYHDHCCALCGLYLWGWPDRPFVRYV